MQAVDERKITHYLLSDSHPEGAPKARFLKQWSRTPARTPKIVSSRSAAGGTRVCASGGRWFLELNAYQKGHDFPMRYEFDWDPAKAAGNLAKHKVAFDEAMTVFLDPLALSRVDENHGEPEERWITIGLSRATKLVLVVHTTVDLEMERSAVRIISARRPTKREKRQYEQASPQD